MLCIGTVEIPETSITSPYLITYLFGADCTNFVPIAIVSEIL